MALLRSPGLIKKNEANQMPLYIITKQS